MNGDMGNPFYKDLPLRKTSQTRSGKNLKRRFLVKLKKRCPIKWRKSTDRFEKSNALIFSKLERNQISQSYDHMKDCLFYYVNGVIQMATFTKSAN